MSIEKAILSINPNAKFTVNADDINQITWLENTAPISVADIQSKIAEMPTAEEEQTAKETAQASAKQKLLDLGLTEAEVKALIGV